MKTSLLKNSQIYTILKKDGKQISLEAIMELDRLVNHKIEDLFAEIKQTSPSIKRIDFNTVQKAFKVITTQQEKDDGKNGCKKCTGIKPIWIDLSRQIQEYTIEEAKIALTAYERGDRYVKK